MRTSRAIQQDLSLEELMDEHHALDQRLTKLNKHLALSPEEQYEAMVIKKRKLALKDRIILFKAQADQSPTRDQNNLHSPSQIWSARQRFTLIMDMIKHHHSIEETATEHGLDANTLEHWYQSFTMGALRALEPTQTNTLSSDDSHVLSNVRQRLHALMADIDARLDTPDA